MAFRGSGGFSASLLLEWLSHQGTCAAHKADGLVKDGGRKLRDEEQGKLNGGRVEQDAEGCKS